MHKLFAWSVMLSLLVYPALADPGRGGTGGGADSKTIGNTEGSHGSNSKTSTFSRMKKDWEEVLASGTWESYHSFVNNYADGFRACSNCDPGRLPGWGDYTPPGEDEVHGPEWNEGGWVGEPPEPEDGVSYGQNDLTGGDGMPP